MIIERLEVERAVDGKIAIAVDGVAITGTVFHLRTSHPRVAGSV